MERRGPNDKVLKGDVDPFGGLFALDSSGKLRYGQGDWMDN